jgi:5-methylcytosine-specific restriction endonuclease McrA
MTEPETELEFVALLETLHARRRAQHEARDRRVSRRSMPKADRENILRKTDGNCHLCGGAVGADWHADHVLAHSAGGAHNPENYLAAHPLCNNYRWDYVPEEFAYVLKLGVWAKTEIERRTRLGRYIAGAFLEYERKRRNRRRSAKVGI